MANLNLADYLVLERRFMLRGASDNIGDGGGRFSIMFDRPNNVLIQPKLATAPILSFTADVELGASFHSLRQHQWSRCEDR